MRTSLLALFFGATLLGAPAHAQFLFGGLRAGGTMSSLSGVEDLGPNVSDIKARTMPSGGLFLEYRFENRISASVDILFSERGSQYTASDTLLGSDGNPSVVQNWANTQTLQYFDVPIVVNYHFMKPESKLDAYAGLGLMGSARFNTRLKTEYTGTAFGSDSTLQAYAVGSNNSTFFNTVDYSLLASAGASYQLSSRLKVGLDLRYAFGILDLRENKVVNLNTNITTNTPIRNTSLVAFLSVHYRLWDGN
jgi:outer membrane protein W